MDLGAIEEVEEEHHLLEVVVVVGEDQCWNQKATEMGVEAEMAWEEEEEDPGYQQVSGRAVVQEGEEDQAC